ncbi:MAG: aminotransferase class V-fold PLP-dependent enzyme [Ignavibacteria bacterium]|nr:aminotransferase class V-fold PLP-dependent enzyme [Ignavibacteria bacterium]MBI3766183.1 aminotransferase class V-fold PLP-dependent enzyme [Ignavibacteriales bacterium]
MGTSRRHFIAQVSQGMIGTWVLNALPETSHARYIIAKDEKITHDDEPFWNVVRDQFPLTRDRTYFNNGTIGPSPYPVIESVKRAMDDLDGRGEYDGWETARPKIAKFMNVDETEISLTHNVTEGINIVAGGLPLKKGDEVIMTTHEHAGNALPWLNRAHLDDIVIKTFKPALTADENLNRINDLITSRTKVIAIPHITCTAGHVFPIKEIAKLGRDKGLWVFFDGAHGPGMIPFNLHDIGCDFYATCCHKWMCGPKGTGFLYVRKEMLDAVQAHWIGAYSDSGWDLTVDPPQFKGYVPTAHRYDFATQSAPIYIGLGAAIDFLYHIGMDNIARRNKALATHLQQELLKLGDNIEMLTPTEEHSRGAVIGFRLKNVTYDKFGEHASKKGFRIRLVGESHLNSIRISTHLYNNFDEVNRFVEAVKELA